MFLLLFVRVAKILDDGLRVLHYLVSCCLTPQHAFHYVFWTYSVVQVPFKFVPCTFIKGALEKHVLRILGRIAVIMTVWGFASLESVQVCPKASMSSQDLDDVVPDLPVLAIDPFGDVWDQSMCPATFS